MLRTTFLYLLIGYVSRCIIARPSFHSDSSSRTDKTKHIDPATGFPLHSNVFQQTLDVQNAGIRRSRSSSEKLHRMKLKSDAKLHPTACIVLDVIRTLESVQCRFGIIQRLELTFSSSKNARFIYKKWLISTATYISGGMEWGCLNETTQQPIVIIQRLRSFQLKNKQIIIKTSQDINLSPLVCFANITMSITVEQIGSKTATALHNKRANVVGVSKSRLDSNYWYFTPLQSYESRIFSPGQTITVRWSYSNIDGTNNLTITLKRKRFRSDAEVTKLRTYIDVQNVTLTIPASLDMSSHDQYYFEFSFRHKLELYQRTSAVFYISTRPSIISRLSPGLNDVYYPGDLVPIVWDSVNFNASSRITVRFCRARSSVIIDAILDTFTVLAMANTYNYTIVKSIDRADNDQYYYFEFDYCTSRLTSNCKELTNYFFVPTRPYVHPTFPSVGDYFLPLQRLTLTWTSAHFVNPNDLLTIKLRNYNYLLPDSDIYSFKCSVSSSGFCTSALPRVSTSFSDYYFEYNWCQYWYSTQCASKSNRFSILTQAIGSWNYDVNRGQALHPLELYSATCDTLCPSPESDLLYVCQMCAEGRAMRIQLACTNCWATYDYSLVQMDLVRKDNSLTLDYLSVRVQSTISVNIDFAISANYLHVLSGNLPFPSVSIIRPIPFSIGNIPFDLSMSFAPSIPWHIEVNTIGNLTGGLDYQLQTNLTLTTSGGVTTKRFDQNLLRNNHPFYGDFQADIIVDLAYRPALQLNMGIFTLEIATEGYIILEDIWQYPPFDPLPTSIFDWDKQKTAEFHISIPSNACIVPHFIRYHIIFGIRRTQMKFFVTITRSRIEFLNDYILTYSSRSILDLGPYELVSGCMHGVQQNTDIPKTMHFVFNRQFNKEKDIANEYLSRSALYDLAKAMNISQTRLYYNSAYGVQHDQMTGVIITFIPSILPYTGDRTVSQLIATLQTQEMNTSSLLYSGLMTSLLNPHQTAKANNPDSFLTNNSM